MIILRTVKSNNKLLDLYFSIDITEDLLIIDIAPNQENINECYIPCVNYYNAIYNMNVSFPITFKIINYGNKKYILNNRFMEFAFNSCDLILDFIHPILTKLNFFIFKEEELKNKEIVKLIFENLTDMMSDEYLKVNKSSLILYYVENYTNKSLKESDIYQYLSKKDINDCNNFKSYKLVFKESELFSIDNHIKIINNKMKNVTPSKYFMSNKNKFRKVVVEKINNKTIEINEQSEKIIFQKNLLKLTFYPPNLKDICSKDDLFCSILKKTEDIKNIYLEIENEDDESNFLQFTENITEKEDVFKTIKKLFKFYSFPIKYQKKLLDEEFEKILYFSINNLDIIMTTIDDKLYLHPEIISFVPSKVKTLYFNILKIFTQAKDNIFESIHFNTKIFFDNIHFEVLRIISEKETMLNNLDDSYNLNKIIYNFTLINKLKNASNIITWKNIPKKIDLFKFLLNNRDLIFYKDKVNKNILPDNCDNRLKKILKDPLEMFKFLKSSKDYIKWIQIIDNKINFLYYNSINISSDDYVNLGKILYLITIIEEQDFNNKNYSDLINLCKQNKDLILDDYRINLKIKEYFKNININLGYLAKNINSSYQEPTSFSSEETEVDKLKKQLDEVNKKYYKYKNKYHKLKSLSITESAFNTTIDNFNK